MASIDSLKSMVYGKLQQRGLEYLWPAIDYIVTRESGWSPTAHNTRGEDSVGLFQMNRAGGLGTGYSVEQLMNPEFNAEAAISYIAGQLQKGVDINAALQPWSTTHGIDAASLIQGGGATMSNGTTTVWETQAAQEWDSANERAENTRSPITVWLDAYNYPVIADRTAYIQARTNQLQQKYGTTTDEIGWANVGLRGRELDLAIDQFEADERQRGKEWALQKFADRMSALQEGRSAAETAVAYERQFAPPGMTQSPYGGEGSAYAQYMRSHGATPLQPLQFQPTSLPRSYEDVMARFTPPTPEYGEVSSPMPGGSVGAGGVGSGGNVSPEMYVGTGGWGAAQGPSYSGPTSVFPGSVVPVGGSRDTAGFIRSLTEAMRRRSFVRS